MSATCRWVAIGSRCNVPTWTVSNKVTIHLNMCSSFVENQFDSNVENQFIYIADENWSGVLDRGGHSFRTDPRSKKPKKEIWGRATAFGCAGLQVLASGPYELHRVGLVLVKIFHPRPYPPEHIKILIFFYPWSSFILIVCPRFIYNLIGSLILFLSFPYNPLSFRL